MDEKPQLVDSIVVSQDIGGPYPIYKKRTFLMWDDGTVTWELPSDSTGDNNG